MGMCSTRTPYRLEIQKNVAGTDQFTSQWHHEKRFNSENESISSFYLPVSLICNADLDARIRFAVVMHVDGTDRVFNHFETSLNQLSNGQTTLDGKNGA